MQSRSSNIAVWRKVESRSHLSIPIHLEITSHTFCCSVIRFAKELPTSQPVSTKSKIRSFAECAVQCTYDKRCFSLVFSEVYQQCFLYIELLEDLLRKADLTLSSQWRPSIMAATAPNRVQVSFATA